MNENGHVIAQDGLLEATNPEGMDRPRQPTFESAWTEIAPRLAAILRRRGAPPDIVDDVVQETAIKLLTAWDRVDPERPLWPFARTIAINSLTDRIRRDGARPIEDIADEAMSYDLEEHVLARSRLRSVGSAMSNLRPADRDLLIAEVTAPVRGASSQLKMARLRARRKLERALKDVAGAFGAVQLAVKRICAFDVPRWLPDAQPVAPIAIGLAAIVGVTGAVAQPTPSADAQRAARPAHVRLVAQHHTDAHNSRTPHRRTTDHDRALRERPPSRESAPTPSGAQETESPHTPSPRPSTVASAGDASARTKQGQGYKSAGVCVESGDSGDGHDTVVTVYDGSQKQRDDPDPCA